MKFARISTLKIPLYYRKFDNKEVFIVKFISCNFGLCLMTQPLFLCSAKKFTLSCVLGKIRVFRPLRRATYGSALRTRKFFEKNLTKNFSVWVLCIQLLKVLNKDKIISPIVKFFEKGCGEKTFF